MSYVSYYVYFVNDRRLLSSIFSLTTSSANAVTVDPQLYKLPIQFHEHKTAMYTASAGNAAAVTSLLQTNQLCPTHKIKSWKHGTQLTM